MKRKIWFLLLMPVMFFLVSHSASAADQVYFYHTDPVGTPLAMTDASGNVVWKADYKPFGEENSVTGNLKNNKEFVGKEKDEETGLSYFGARYMESRIGRFAAVDPVRAVDKYANKSNNNLLINPQRLNLYAYALNNPHGYIDQNGEFSVRATYFALATDVYMFRLSLKHGPNSSTAAKGLSLMSETAGRYLKAVTNATTKAITFIGGEAVTYDNKGFGILQGYKEIFTDAGFASTLNNGFEAKEIASLKGGYASEETVLKVLNKFAESPNYKEMGYPSPVDMVEKAKTNLDNSNARRFKDAVK